jgi:hypothetical protein
MGTLDGLQLDLLIDDVAQGEALTEWAERIYPGLREFASLAGVPDLRVLLVLTDDFAGEVTSRLGLPAGEGYKTDRLGGTAVAKNLDLPGHPDTDVVVFDAAVLRFDDPPTTAMSTYVVAHEIGHSIFRHVRRLGQEFDEVADALTGLQVLARAIVRAAVEEYRCDRLAAILLEAGGWFSVTEETGTPRPWRTSDSLGGPVHRAQVADVLNDHVHPGWPDAVMAYRRHELSLDDLWETIVAGTDQLMTLLAHAEAEASELEIPGPLHAECADHPGAVLYAAPVWDSIMRVVAEQKVVPDLAEFATRELDVLDVGEGAIFMLWSTLGVRPREEPSGDLFIEVGDPER